MKKIDQMINVLEDRIYYAYKTINQTNIDTEIQFSNIKILENILLEAKNIKSGGLYK